MTVKILNARLCAGMDKTKDNEKKTKPKVMVFGEEIGNDNDNEYYEEDGSGRHFHFHHNRYRRHGSFTWGLFFILIGVLFLLSNFGALPAVTWSQLARLWPVLIILIGLDTLMGHSEVSEIISSAIGLFIFLTILGVILFNVSPQLIAGLPQGALNYFHTISIYLRLK